MVLSLMPFNCKFSLRDRQRMLTSLLLRYSVATVMKATYGRDIKSAHDEYVVNAEIADKIVTGEDAPGSGLIDLLPVCQSVATRSEHY